MRGASRRRSVKPTQRAQSDEIFSARAHVFERPSNVRFTTDAAGNSRFTPSLPLPLATRLTPVRRIAAFLYVSTARSLKTLFRVFHRLPRIRAVFRSTAVFAYLGGLDDCSKARLSAQVFAVAVDVVPRVRLWSRPGASARSGVRCRGAHGCFERVPGVLHGSQWPVARPVSRLP